MKESIRKQDFSSEFYTSERCFIAEQSNSTDDEALSIARARVEPGVTTRWHRLRKSAERYYILSGIGRVEIGDLPAEDVKPGDVVIIPPMSRQRIANTGQEDLVFLALCTPPFTKDDYEDIDELPVC
ncbi:cupin domain-containing protein [Marinobacter sp. F4216]|uniref:cupin domain-containing protein n=1 Tax=Marinobacter sp. F4216 TaxID=2874281 RepID=UPI001CBFFF8E|nr:cupin domain-containing protein [Marinobacter sp. F4216]MBZ2167420.1 cupin domain-containing protein [Marinobacter sp. F4216]